MGITTHSDVELFYGLLADFTHVWFVWGIRDERFALPGRPASRSISTIDEKDKGPDTTRAQTARACWPFGPLSSYILTWKIAYM